MPLPMPSDSPQILNVSAPTYPALTKRASGKVDGIFTDATCVQFADRIMVTVTQGGRLAQWIHVPLETSDPNFADHHLIANNDENSLLPMAHLTPKTLLGGSTPERETVGQLYATQIASTIATKNPQENRTLVFGLGLSKFEANRESFYDILDLVNECL